MINKKLHGILLLFLSTIGWCQIHPVKHLLKAQQDAFFYNQRYLVKDSILHNQIVLLKDSLKISSNDSSITSNTSLHNTLPSFRVFYSSKDEKPLSGLKVAIDPGHTANSLETAKIEGKFVSLSKEGKSCSIYESKSTWLVGLVLKHLLEQQGVEVLLTRPLLEKDARKITFDYWLRNLAKPELDSLFSVKSIDETRHQYLLNCLADTSIIFNKKELFKYAYNVIDIESRANTINAFEPHITIIVHFNVDDSNIGWSTPTEKNYNMIFVPGAFMAEELESLQEIQEFKNLLASSRIRQSHTLGTIVLKQLNQLLDMSALEDDRNIKYLEHYSLKSPYKGVYSRNLSLTRKIESTLCYGETIYQDNWNYCHHIARENIEFEGHLINETIYKVALGYFKGIKEYLEYEFE